MNIVTEKYFKCVNRSVIKFKDWVLTIQTYTDKIILMSIGLYLYYVNNLKSIFNWQYIIL